MFPSFLYKITQNQFFPTFHHHSMTTCRVVLRWILFNVFWSQILKEPNPVQTTASKPGKGEKVLQICKNLLHFFECPLFISPFMLNPNLLLYIHTKITLLKLLLYIQRSHSSCKHSWETKNKKKSILYWLYYLFSSSNLLSSCLSQHSLLQIQKYW